MKKLLKNKDFLPNKYVEEKLEKKTRKNIRSCKILGFAMVFLVPFTTGSLLQKLEKPKIVKESKSIDQNEIIKWLEFCDENVKIKCNKKELEINITDREKLIKLCNNNKIIISNIEHLGENNYLEEDNYIIKGTVK